MPAAKFLFAMAALAAPVFCACDSALLSASSDYKYLIGSVPDTQPVGDFRWLRNGAVWRTGRGAQTFLLRGGEGMASVEGTVPVVQRGVSLLDARWGEAFTVDGQLAYPRERTLPLDEGTVEMWIAAREDGASSTYTRNNVLLSYTAANGETFAISQAGRDGTLYLGGTVRGQWESAYGGRASMWPWKAGDWHHIAATYSASEGRMRFYLDGVLTADTNEKHYWAAAATGERFTLGNAAFLIDEVRISSRMFSETEVRSSAARSEAPRNGETWLATADISAGDAIGFEEGACGGATFAYQGIPIFDADPASTLLPPGTTALTLTVKTAVETSCRYGVNSKAAFNAMTPFDSGAGGTSHTVALSGLSSDPQVVNEVFVRCASAPDFALRLIYRSLSRANAEFPRIGNLWGSGGVLARGIPYASQLAGFFGAELSSDVVAGLRAANPEIVVLTSINTVENHGLPEDYYLHDTKGNKIEVWPGTYRLNLTKPYVAEYQAKWAYQKMLDSNLMYDGCFFDNFFTNQSWLKADIHGRAVQLDADEDGKPDDPAWLDSAWRAGVFNELAIWRKLMPHALATGHLPRPVPADVGEIFNGSGILFISTNVIDGKSTFADFWDSYQRWWEVGRKPVITAIESSPANQIAYGYGYNILTDTPKTTQEYARTDYRYMRFALATALMNDGYYWHDFGDILHGTDWRYDEYDFKLGYPTGAPERVQSGAGPAPNLLVNSGFEDALSGSWNLSVVATNGAAATLTRDTDAVQGRYAALITVTNAGAGTGWHVDFNQRDRAFKKGVTYELSFSAKADAPRDIQLSSQKQVADWRNFGLSGTVSLTRDWKRFTVSFVANETVSDSRVQFFVGAKTGKVWLDDVKLVEQAPQVFRRYFTKGAVVVNGTPNTVTVPMPEGYKRFSGSEAPRYQYIVDDDASAFRATGNWSTVTFDTGQWKSTGPYYHNWGTACRKLSGQDGTAQWNLQIPEDDTYAITVWWASPPEQKQWSRRAVYEIVANGKVVASQALDQTQPGDRWYPIAEVPLSALDKPYLRVRNEDTGALIADAVSVRSQARYNDGSAAHEVTLAPYDGILLKKQ